MRHESALSTIKIYIICEKGDGGSDIRAVPDSSCFPRNRRDVLPLSPCHTNDAQSTFLPMHIKGTKSRASYLKASPLSDIQQQDVVSKLKLCISCFSYSSWWDNAIYVHQWNINRKFYDPYGLKLWQYAGISLF